METFLLVFAAIFPVVNPPGGSVIRFRHELKARRPRPGVCFFARRVAVNAFSVIMNLVANCRRACYENLWHFNSGP